MAKLPKPPERKDTIVSRAAGLRKIASKLKDKEVYDRVTSRTKEVLKSRTAGPKGKLPESVTTDQAKKVMSFLLQRQKDSSKALYYDRKKASKSLSKSVTQGLVKDKPKRKPRIATAFELYKQNKKIKTK